MHRIRSFAIRALNFFRRSRLEQDLREQMAAHRDMIEADLIRRGVSAEEAARTARRAVGNDLLVRELSLDEMGHRLIAELLRDVRYAVRGLLWNPGLTIVAILSFALGIGANTAIFSSVDQMLFRPLPYDDPDSLFVVQEYAVEDNQGSGTLPARYVVEAHRSPRGFVDLGVVTSPGRILYNTTSDSDGNPALSLAEVSFNTLRILGVTPIMGRDFTEEDARQKRPLCVVTREAWKAKLSGDPAVIGRALWRERRRCEIVGVLPPGFLAPPSPFGGRRADGLALSSTLLATAEDRDRSGPPYLRLKAGVTVAAAGVELNAIADRVKAELPRGPGARDTVLRLTPIRRALFGRFGAYSWLVTGAAGLVLLLTCANMAALLLLRAESREHIAAVRVALGASPARLIRTALIESLTLAAAGSVAALIVLAWSSDALRLLLPQALSEYAASVFDLRVLAFSLFVACGSAVASIALPSCRLWRIDVVSALQGAGGSSRRLLGGRSLLVIEAAIGVVLVAGAAATSHSLIGLLRTDLGFDPADLYQIDVSFPQAPDSESRFQRYYGTVDVLRGLPGVRSAAGSNVLSTIIGVAGWTGFGEGYQGFRWHVSRDYFETLRQPVLAGRAISAADVAGRARVAVLGQSGLRQVWPDASPADAVGRVLRFPGQEPLEVIGVVSDLRTAYAQTPMPALYMPITPDMMRYMMYVVRMEPGRTPSVRDVRERIRMEIGEPLTVGVSAVNDGIDATLRSPKFESALFGLFGVIALASAAVGLYGVCSFEVASRRREMGVRLALGGSPRDLQRLVVAHAIRPALIGVGAGLLLAYWAAKFLQSFLHEVDARDPWTLGLVAAVLILTASTAAWLPARRASRLNPTDVLRAM